MKRRRMKRRRMKITRMKRKGWREEELENKDKERKNEEKKDGEKKNAEENRSEKEDRMGLLQLSGFVRNPSGVWQSDSWAPIYILQSVYLSVSIYLIIYLSFINLFRMYKYMNIHCKLYIFLSI